MGTTNVNKNKLVLKVDSAGTLLTPTNAELNQAADNSGKVAAGSTTANLANWGVSTLGSTGATFTLTAPVAGVEKELLATSTSVQNVDSGSTTVTFDGTTGIRLILNNSNEGVALRGLSTTRWFIVSNTNSVAVSTGA